MPGSITVRPYEARDRAAVRHICHVTGYMGEPIDWQWKDEESFADAWTGYYTDVEPESALVVDIDGEVGGYLLGCVDSRRAWNPVYVLARHALMRGVAFRPGTARTIWRSVTDIATDAVARRLPDPKFYDARWPAHLHIDLLEVARGKGAGSELVRRWLDSLRRRNVPGCHLETLAENKAAIAFFEAIGFRRMGRTPPVPGERARDGSRLHSQLMVQDLT